MSRLVLLRHGESRWNRENLFTGWTDVDLSENGVREAREAGRILKAEGLRFDVAYTSVLKRAIRTLWLTLEEMDRVWTPVVRHWRLNERHYGALQGLNKKEMAEKHGKEQVHIWRRSYDTPPPLLENDDDRHPRHEEKYAALNAAELPRGESLKDTVDRFLPYWFVEIAPRLQAGETVLIAAHGNSLRALVKHLDGISDADIPGLNIPTGRPLVYELDERMRGKHHYYAGEDT